MRVSLKFIIVVLIGLIMLVLMIVPGKAEESYDPCTDYMAMMEIAVTTGDAEAGVAAETLRTNKIADMELTVPVVHWDELYLLSKIIYAEAGSEWLPDEWKMSVGEVVLNRVVSSTFPNTIKEVITQPGQYYGVNSSYFNNLLPSLRCVEVARKLLEGNRILNDPRVVYQANFTQGSGVHTALYDKYLGWTYFCYE